MKTLADVKRRLTEGVKLLCLENTLVAARVGQERTVLQVQTNGFWWREAGMQAKQRAWTEFPKATACRIVDDDTFEFHVLERTFRQPDTTTHYVRLRFVAETEVSA